MHEGSNPSGSTKGTSVAARAVLYRPFPWGRPGIDMALRPKEVYDSIGDTPVIPLFGPELKAAA